MYEFFDEVKKEGGILTKFWFPGMLVYEVGHEVAVVSLFLSLKDPGHGPGFGFFSSWGLAGDEAVVVAVGQVMVPGSNVYFSVSPSSQNIKLNKNQKYPKLKSLIRSLYEVYLASLQWQTESGKYSSPVCLSVQSVGGFATACLLGFMACCRRFPSCPRENVPNPKSGRGLVPD